MNPDSQDIDGLPFIDALRKSVEKQWSGILRVSKADDQVGSIFMRDGCIAWATSKNQTENFASFLERIGLIPRDILSETVRKYKSLGKTKKLGELLEEEGLISRDKLRECLGAHIRAAIKSLTEDHLLIIEASHGEMEVDANLLFSLDELLALESPGEDSSEGEAVGPDHPSYGKEGSFISNVLSSLASLPGYRFSFVSGADDKQMALHKSDGEPDPETLIKCATEWINLSVGHWSDRGLFKMDSLILEHEKGILVAQFIDDERKCFAAVAFDKGGKLGVIKHKLNDIISSILQIMNNATGNA